MTTTITVCDTCAYSEAERLADGRTGGEILAEHVRAAAAGRGVDVRTQSCLMGCSGHCVVALQAPGKMNYVLGRFAPDADSAAAIVDYAALHGASEGGVVPYRQWPQGVKGHFVARIPPMES